MLDEKDLEAIGKLIDTKLEAQEDRINARMDEQEQRLNAKMDEQEQRLMRYMNIIVENRIEPQLKLLAEGHQLLLEQMEPLKQDVEMLKEAI